jgi:hypothetical protein
MKVRLPETNEADDRYDVINIERRRQLESIYNAVIRHDDIFKL